MPTAPKFKTLKVIPEPDLTKRAVIKMDAKAGNVVWEGGGDVHLRCGSCATVIAKNVNPAQYVGFVIYCNHCGSFCEV